MDPEYAEKLGVNIDDMLISQPDSGEQALEIAETLVRSNSVDVIVIDSVAALVPRAELDGEMGDSLPGLQARLDVAGAQKDHGDRFQLEHLLYLYQPASREDRRLFRLARNDDRRQGSEILRQRPARHPPHRRHQGRRPNCRQPHPRKVVKNKCAPPFRESEFDIMYGEGISREGDLLDLAVNHNVVEKSGAWFSYKGERLGQGRDNVKTMLKENTRYF